LVHGDPKPSNIFFSSTGPVFVDWQGVCAAHASADVANALGASLAGGDVDAAPQLIADYLDVLRAHGIAVDRGEFDAALSDAARHFVVRAVSASVTKDPRFHEAHGVMTARRIAFALRLT